MTRSSGKTLALLAMTVGLGMAQAQTTATTAAPAGAPPAAPPLSATEQWIKDAKNPAPWLSWGADLRLRNEYFNNSLTLSDGLPRHEQDYFRYRGRVWMSLMPMKDLSINTRLSAEPREWMKPSYTSANANGSGMEWRYGIFDNLNVKWQNVVGQPLTLTAGRQDIQYGDPLNWWLVADGTPGDGSWTFFLDSIRLNLDLKEAKTKVDAVYIYQNAQPDAWVPTMGRSTNPYGQSLNNYNLTEQDEQGVILYVSNKSIEKTQIDAYFVYKHDNAQYSYGDNADIYTLGARVKGDVGEHWQYSAEGAYQFGNKQLTGRVGSGQVGEERGIGAWGANGRLAYQVKDPMKNVFRFDVEFLSGDNPASHQNEQFDLLWGRWPRWSELYIYSYVPEVGRIAQIGNIIRLGPAWNITPVKNLDFSAMYNPLFSDRVFSNADGLALPPSGGFGDGHFRGHYLQTILKYKFNPHVSAHLWGEFVWMGDYYQNRDLMSFLRAELLFTF